MAIHKILVLNGMSSVTDADLSGLAISFINSAGGIVGANDYQVSAQSTPNMTVQVAGGRAWIPNTTTPVTNMYGTYLDSPTNVTIANNTSGQPRVDYIILWLNLVATGGTGSNVPQLADAQGPLDGSHNPPTPTQIISGTSGTTWTGIGAGNPYLILAQIGQSPTYIPSGVGSITSTMISSLRSFAFFTTGQTVPVPLYEEFTDQSVAPANPAAGKTRLFTISSNLFMRQPSGSIVQIGSSSLVNNGNAGATPQVDWTQGISQAYTLNVNATFQTFANGVAGEKGILLLKQPATGGPTTATWPASNITNGIVWPNGVAPVLSTTAGNTDVIGFFYDNVISRYRGFYQTGYQL